MKTVLLFSVGFAIGWYARVILRAYRRYCVNRDGVAPLDRVKINL